MLMRSVKHFKISNMKMNIIRSKNNLTNNPKVNTTQPKKKSQPRVVSEKAAYKI